MTTVARNEQRIANTSVEVNGRAYRTPRRPTVVIVVDGFDPAYLEHGFANGTLPTMKSFEREGFVGTADCSMPSNGSGNNDHRRKPTALRDHTRRDERRGRENRGHYREGQAA